MVYVRRNRRNNRKRWFVSATAGKSVPFVGGSTLSFGSHPKTATQKKGKRELVKLIKTVARNTVEETNKLDDEDLIHSSLVQETLLTKNILGALQKGENADNYSGYRESDAIFLKNVKLDGFFQNIVAYNKDIHLRIMVVKHQHELLGSSGSFASGLGSTDIFHPSTVNMFRKEINHSKIQSLLLDKHFHWSFPDVGDGHTKQCKDKRVILNIPINKKIVFNSTSAGTNYLRNGNYYIVIAGFIGGLTQGTDPIFITADIHTILNYTNVAN